MTTRELADVAGVSDETVRVKAKELFPGKFQNGKKTRFSEREAIAIMGELRKKGFVQPPQNLEVASKNLGGQSNLTPKDIELISTLTASIVSKIFESLDSRMSKIETRVEHRQALLPPPEMAPRNRVNMLVRQYASKNNMPFQDAWRDLYKEFYYRTSTNAQVCAKNRSMTVLDYIESEGQMELLESIASDM